MPGIASPGEVAFLEKEDLAAQVFNQRIEDCVNLRLDASRVPGRFLHCGSGGHDTSGLRLEASRRTENCRGGRLQREI